MIDQFIKNAILKEVTESLDKALEARFGDKYTPGSDVMFRYLIAQELIENAKKMNQNLEWADQYTPMFRLERRS